MKKCFICLLKNTHFSASLGCILDYICLDCQSLIAFVSNYETLFYVDVRKLKKGKNYMSNENDFVGKPINFPSMIKEVGGVKLERDPDPRMEQLLGAIWILVNKLGGNQVIPFNEFIEATNQGAKLQIKISETRDELILLATKEEIE